MNNNKVMVGKKLQAAASLFPELLSDNDRSNLYKLETKSKVLTKSSKIQVTSNNLVLPKELESVVYDDLFDIVALMESSTDPVTGSFKNLRIDDRDLPYAKNFYDFSTNIVGKATSVPWARQLAVCLIGLGEVCVAEDTMVTTNKGLLQINQLSGDREGLQVIDGIKTVTLKGNNKVSHAGLTKRKARTISVNSIGEIPIRCTPNHEILVAKNDLTFAWVSAKELQINDLLVSKVGANLWPISPCKLATNFNYNAQFNNAYKPTEDFLPLTKVTPELARLIGYVLTDGSIEERTVTFCNNDRNLLLDFLYCANKVFKLPFNVINLAFKKIHSEAINVTLKLPTYTSKYLQSIGVIVTTGYHHKIPDFILQSPAYIVCNCLKAMFDSDGYIDHDASNLNNIRTRIGIIVTSKVMIQQVHLLLKNLGVDGTYTYITRKNSTTALRNNGTSDLYTWLANTGQSKLLFAQLVGSNHKHKLINVKNIINNSKLTQRRPDLGNKIPAGYLNWGSYPNLLSILNTKHNNNNNNFTVTKSWKEKNPRFSHFFEYRTFPSIINIKEVLETVGMFDFMHSTPERKILWDILYDLNNHNYSFSPVVSLNKEEDIDVYDLTVPKTSSFQANGILVHNCTHCTKPKYLNILNIPKDADVKDVVKVLVLLEHGVCRKCKRTKHDLIKNYNLRDYQQIILCFGQRAGKSAISAFLSAYVTHCYLMFPDLSSLARKEMQASTQLTGTFVSLTFGKAVGVLWTPYKKIVEQSTWFEQHRVMLDYHSAKYGVKLYNDSTIYLDYQYKNIRMYPSGPRSTVLRGDTRILAVIDELALFKLPTGDAEEDENSERANGDECHKSLSRSLTTVSTIHNRLLSEGISAAPACILMCVSSPISQRDKVLRLIKQSKTEEGEKYIYAQQMATWEINPAMNRNNPIIALAYSENSEKADRDYGANPPSVQSPFMRSPDLQDIFINGHNSHTLKYNYDRPGELYGTLEKVRSIKWPSLITIDAGAVNNSFCIIVGHYDFDSAKTVVSTIIECMPHENRRINFNLIYEHVIKVLAKDLNAISMLADQWQSIDLLHRIKDDMGNNPLQKPKVLSKQHSPNRKDFDVLLSMCRNKNLIFPSIAELDKEKIDSGNVENFRVDMLNRPVAHLYLQLLTIRDIGENKCPTKGDGMTDDIARALVLFAAKLHTPVIMARLKEAIPWVNETGKAVSKAMPMPSFRGRSR